MQTQIEQLYSQHYKDLWQTARNLLGNDEEARDAVSDVFTDLLATDKALLPGPRAASYLQVSVRNRCLNMLEHRKVVKATEQKIPHDNVATDYEEPPLDKVLDYMNSALTVKTSNVMKQRFLERKKYDEIATEMGISRKSVYKHLSQGLHQLRTHFAWYYAGLALLLLLSGMAYAVYRHTRLRHASDTVAEPVTTLQKIDSAILSTIHYEDATLEQILTDIASYHNVKLHFFNDKARRLRLHFDWVQAEPLNSTILTLDAFQNISVELRDKTLIVR